MVRGAGFVYIEPLTRPQEHHGTGLGQATDIILPAIVRAGFSGLHHNHRQWWPHDTQTYHVVKPRNIVDIQYATSSTTQQHTESSAGFLQEKYVIRRPHGTVAVVLKRNRYILQWFAQQLSSPVSVARKHLCVSIIID